MLAKQRMSVSSLVSRAVRAKGYKRASMVFVCEQRMVVGCVAYLGCVGYPGLGELSESYPNF